MDSVENQTCISRALMLLILFLLMVFILLRSNTMAPQNILLFGAAGQIGTFILDAILSARGKFNRIAIFTSPHTAETKASHLKKLKQQNVEVIVGDVEDENAVKEAYQFKTHF